MGDKGWQTTKLLLPPRPASPSACDGVPLVAAAFPLFIFVSSAARCRFFSLLSHRSPHTLPSPASFFTQPAAAFQGLLAAPAQHPHARNRMRTENREDFLFPRRSHMMTQKRQ